MTLQKSRVNRLAGSVLVFAITLSMLLVPVHVKKAQAFDWIDPPYPGAADGWIQVSSGKYQMWQGEYKAIWESKIEYELNEAGQVVKKTGYSIADDSDNGSATYYEYDSEGRVSRYTTDNSYYKNYQYVYDYKDDGTIVTTETWDYENADGETEKRTIVRTNFPFPELGWYMGEWKCEFDSKGRLIHRWTDEGSDWVCTYEEDSLGRTSKGTIVMDQAGFERLYTYHEDGSWTMREASRTGYEEFTYNEKNQLIQYVNSYSDEPISFDYTYDEAGNNTLIQSNKLMKWEYSYEKLPDNTPAEPQFEDVPENAFYADAVKWAVENGVTNGLDPKHFGPGQTCTRGQIVTFIWRAAGQPEPTLTENPFTDVAEDAFYYKAVLWAVENKITSGTSAATFSPKDDVTREQTVTFLWRKAGEPEVQSDNPFADVPKGAYYTKAVLWAVKNEITKGMDTKTFGTGQPCTRGQIVTFLFRAK